MAAPKKDNPRKAVTYKLPPALLDQIAARYGKGERTAFVEHALWRGLGSAPRCGGCHEVLQAPASDGLCGFCREERGPNPPDRAQAPSERANAPVLDPAQARAAAFRAATSR